MPRSLERGRVSMETRMWDSAARRPYLKWFAKERGNPAPFGLAQSRRFLQFLAN